MKNLIPVVAASFLLLQPQAASYAAGEKPNATPVPSCAFAPAPPALSRQETVAQTQYRQCKKISQKKIECEYQIEAFNRCYSSERDRHTSELCASVDNGRFSFVPRNCYSEAFGNKRN